MFAVTFPLETLFSWAQDNLAGFTCEDCDESYHYYFQGEMVGGFAGDRRELFFNNNKAFQKIRTMYAVSEDKPLELNPFTLDANYN